MTPLLLLAGSALATEAPVAEPDPGVPGLTEPAREYKVSFTIGPVLGVSFPGADTPGPLRFPELTFETRQGRKAGIGVVAGFGSVNEVPAWEIGFSGQGYFVGDFEGGIGLGGRGAYTHTIARGDVEAGTGIGFGPFVVAKYVAPFGLTLQAQGGVAAGFAGQSFTEVESQVMPIANVGLGWSL